MREINCRNWYGHLTVENSTQIAEAIKELLTDKKYTFVALNDLYGPLPKPEVRTSQVMEKLFHKISDYSDGSGQWAHIWANDSYGVWGFSSVQTEDHSPYIVFEKNSVRIHHNAPAGNKLIWVMAVED